MPAAAWGENGAPGPGVTNGNGNGFVGALFERISPRVDGGNVPNSSNEERADGLCVLVVVEGAVCREVFGGVIGRAGVPGSTFVEISICDGLDERSSESLSEASAEFDERFESG
ncbi:MAG: hypothetical protein IT281_10820 [Ignavibacteria bacterium]|nr:hypothetical protein [Ignavibacteria bacterium]